MLDHSTEQLSIDAHNAKVLGVSYGQYKAMQRDGRVMMPKEKPPVPKPTVPKGEKKCKICGEMIPSNSNRRSYCSRKCAEEADAQYRRTYRRKIKVKNT